MNDDQLLTAILQRVNRAVNGDTLMTVLIEGLYREFPKAPREQVQRVLENARVHGLIWVLVGAFGLTETGVARANQA
jgi:hypothetical protein